MTKKTTARRPTPTKAAKAVKTPPAQPTSETVPSPRELAAQKLAAARSKTPTAAQPATPTTVKGKGRKAIIRKAGTVRDSRPSNGVGDPAKPAPKAIRRRPKDEQKRTGNGPILEVNPKLESTRDRLPKAQGQTGGAKPMTFAERQRAEAEAMFQQIAPKWKEEPPPPPTNNGASPHFHKSEFEIRVSERDSLTTALRLEQNKKRSLAIAQKLADDFQLPPDQGVLMKVLTLRDERLTLLALEELLELEDRGRVRPSDDLVKAVKGSRGKNPEIAELRTLLLQKLGVKKSK